MVYIRRIYSRRIYIYMYVYIYMYLYGVMNTAYIRRLYAAYIGRIFTMCIRACTMYTSRLYTPSTYAVYIYAVFIRRKYTPYTPFTHRIQCIYAIYTPHTNGVHIGHFLFCSNTYPFELVRSPFGTTALVHL